MNQNTKSFCLMLYFFIRSDDVMVNIVYIDMNDCFCMRREQWLNVFACMKAASNAFRQPWQRSERISAQNDTLHHASHYPCR